MERDVDRVGLCIFVYEDGVGRKKREKEKACREQNEKE